MFGKRKKCDILKLGAIMKTLKYYLTKATAEDFALGAFNFCNMETLQAIADASAKCNSPAIISVSETSLKYIGSFISSFAKEAKQINPSLFLHLDHGKSFAVCKYAIDLGFDSVMIDASTLPLYENIKQTKKVCDYAHKKGVLVEGELGQIKGVEDGAWAKEDNFTLPDEAKTFVERTGVDLLAISIGTSHGIYKESGNNLRFDILERIEKLLPNTPLVLHGASSVDKAQINCCIKNGGKLEKAGGIATCQLQEAAQKHHIAKINTDTDLRLAYTAALRKYLTEKPYEIDPRKYMNAAKEAVEKVVSNKIKNTLNSENKREL